METFFNDFYETLIDYYHQLVNVLPKIMVAAVLFAILYMLANRSRTFVKTRLDRRMDDPLLAAFLSRVVKIALVLLAFLVALQVLGLAGVAAGIVTGASVSAIVIGFAFKDIGENFLAGVMLAFNRPFHVGDIVELNNQKGKVVALHLRDTRIKTFDGKDIFIPNAAIVKNPVVNYTMDGFLRYEFTVGLEYGSDVSEAVAVILRTVNRMPGVLQETKKPSVMVTNLGTSALELTVYYWLDTFDKAISPGDIKTHTVDQVLTELDLAGFYMPGEVIEMKNYKGEDLKTKYRADEDSTKVA